MSQHENKLDDTLLDRLVDGELSDAEYREALVALDSHPDGWRRCALAFLEAQAWGRDLGALRTEKPVAVVVASGSSHKWSWQYVMTLAVASAASFFLMFSVARYLQKQDLGRGFRNDMTARGLPSQPDADQAGNRNQQFVNDTASEANRNELNSAPMGRYQLVVNGDSGTPQAVEMPVFAADDPRAGLLLDEYASIPRDMIRELQKRGNEVERHRKWIPVQANSGTPMYVPVDELQITPVSNLSFQ